MIFEKMNLKSKFTIVNLLFLLVTLMIIPANAVTLTDYEDLSTNNTIHIKTEIDLYESNFTVLFDNKPLSYNPTHDITITGLNPDTEYSVLLISSYGQIQEINIKTDKEVKAPFYYEYGALGLFVLTLIMLIIGYYIPLVNVIAVLFALLGFITSLKTDNNALTAMIFIILFAVAGLMFGYKNKVI